MMCSFREFGLDSRAGNGYSIGITQKEPFFMKAVAGAYVYYYAFTVLFW